MYIYIKSMSETQQELRRDIVSHGDLIVEHLMKLLLFPNAQEYNHWKSEIHSFMPRIKKQKKNNKFPKESFIFEALTTSTDILEGVVANVIDDCSELCPKPVDIAVAEYFSKDYFSWLSKELSSKGFVTKQEVMKKLDQLISNYAER